MENKVIHPLKPIYNTNSKILILGSMPSPKSRENGFYYGHPQNRFWRVIASVLDVEVPVTNEDKKALLLSRHIALWDVLASCTISGADDGSIKNPVANDLRPIFQIAPIRAVFTTGSKAAILYRRHCQAQGNMAAIQLPSTSPANARMNLERLTKAYCVILPYLQL